METIGYTVGTEEIARILDPYELLYRTECRCDGAKSLNTFECYMRSYGGCGFLPQCPNDCGGHLFLNQNLEIRGGGVVPITARNLPTMNTSYEKMEGECVCS